MMPRHRHTVLIIDDDPDILDAFAVTLTLADVVTLSADSGREALALIDQGLRPCAIFLDIRMPGLDGKQVWNELRRRGPDVAAIPVIFVSGEMPSAIAQTAGAAEWLRKPVGVRELAAALTRACELV